MPVWFPSALCSKQMPMAVGQGGRMSFTLGVENQDLGAAIMPVEVIQEVANDDGLCF